MARTEPAVASAQAIVVGAGLAGASAALALAARGFEVTVLEAGEKAAGQASGNEAGIFHGGVNAVDGPMARLYHAAALVAASVYGPAIRAGLVAGQMNGLLHVHKDPLALPRMQALLAQRAVDTAQLNAALPAGTKPPAQLEVLALSVVEASALAGVSLRGPAWFYPQGGWLDPGQWVRHVLTLPRIQLRCACSVARLQAGVDGKGWQLLDLQGQLLAQAPTVVLAAASATPGLLSGLTSNPLAEASGPGQGALRWPLMHSRGQTSQWNLGEAGHAGDPNDALPTLKLPLSGDGYVVPLTRPGQAAALMCGATRQRGEPDGLKLPPVLEADHHHNMRRLQRLTGLAVPTDLQAVSGRAAWRLHSKDRLPLAGAVPTVLTAGLAAGLESKSGALPLRQWPRQPGLFVLTALGARGITLAPLLGQVVAALASGHAPALAQDLLDAIDPARWLWRQAQRAPDPGS